MTLIYSVVSMFYFQDAPIGTSLFPSLEVIDIDETSNVAVLTVTCDQSLRGNVS